MNSDSIENTVGSIEDSVDEIWTLLFSTSYLLPTINSSLLRGIKTGRIMTNSPMFKRQIYVFSMLFPELDQEEITNICVDLIDKKKLKTQN